VTRLSLAQRILALDAALEQIPHAFGGALALAYYAEPRATVDIDLNLFVTPDRFPEVAASLVALGIEADDPAVGEIVRRDGQVRVMWDERPVDLFFAYDAFHHAAARAIRTVPFAESSIPILAPEHLVVCKAVFSRPQDWVDIDAIVSTGTVMDAAEVLRWVGRIAGDADPRYERVAALLTRR
jgi:Nucleotidyl transferase AbiEii toxin, Type IV TA system